MRQIFSSPRLENVERVAAFLREHEIEVRITNGRSYKGSRRGDFSYREQDGSGATPAVWVVKSDDQPRARELMREIGLLDSARSPTSYLPVSVLERDRDSDGGDAARRRAFRLRAGLFIAITTTLGLSLFAWWKSETAGSAVTSTASVADTTPPWPAAAADGQTYVIATPKALAAMLAVAELGAHDAQRLCLSVDGRPPSAEQRAALMLPPDAALAADAECASNGAPAGLLRIAIGEYRTDGSGQGTVRVELTDRGKDGDPRRSTRMLEVRRDGDRWRVLRVAL